MMQHPCCVGCLCDVLVDYYLPPTSIPFTAALLTVRSTVFNVSLVASTGPLLLHSGGEVPNERVAREKGGCVRARSVLVWREAWAEERTRAWRIMVAVCRMGVFGWMEWD